MHGRHQGTRLTGEDRALIRRRIAAGDRFAEAARAVGCSTKSVQRLVDATGGIKDRTKCLLPRRLALKDREEISRQLELGSSLRKIAERLNRAPSTVSREVEAGGGRAAYRAWIADKWAQQRRKRPKPLKLATNVKLRQVVEECLEKKWSPQQISKHLRRE